MNNIAHDFTHRASNPSLASPLVAGIKNNQLQGNYDKVGTNSNTFTGYELPSLNDRATTIR